MGSAEAGGRSAEPNSQDTITDEGGDSEFPYTAAKHETFDNIPARLLSAPKARHLLEFKLHKLENTKLRYDVVYKNLLRDFRRFFC